jgi:hypothetical protein
LVAVFFPPTSTSNGHGSITVAAVSEAVHPVGLECCRDGPGRLPVSGEEGFARFIGSPYDTAALVDIEGHLLGTFTPKPGRTGWLLNEDDA